MEEATGQKHAKKSSISLGYRGYTSSGTRLSQISISTPMRKLDIVKQLKALSKTKADLELKRKTPPQHQKQGTQEKIVRFQLRVNPSH
jgi:hypothetical protein